MNRLLVSLIFLAFILPVSAAAQLSSTNYEVDVQYVGEAGGGYATSTNYQLGESGTSSASEPSPESESGSTVISSGSRMRDEKDPTGPGTEPGEAISDASPGAGAEGQKDTGSGDSGIPTYDPVQDDSESSDLFGSPNRVWPIKEIVSKKAVTIMEVFLSSPYLYSVIILGALLLILFMLRRNIWSDR